MILDLKVSHTGDDICNWSTSDPSKIGSSAIQEQFWDALMAGTEVAREQGLYGAGQDMLADSFSGNVKGLGPAVIEMQFEERESEPVLFFAADKTDPGAYNWPLWKIFTDPANTPGLMLSSQMVQGFRFVIMDVSVTEHDRVIELNSPEDNFQIAALLRDNERFVVESVWSRATGEQCAAVSTTRLHNIAGKYTGKDDPIMAIRAQRQFPAVGEIIAPFADGHYVAGFMRGSCVGPLMPVRQNTGTSYFDGPPLVSCLAYCLQDGKFNAPVDLFDHPFWDEIRAQVSRKAMEIRKQGFSGCAMLPFSELEYGGITDILDSLNSQWEDRVATVVD
jgi:fructose 1,6-bisphosphate aldolase/phosphatase